MPAKALEAGWSTCQVDYGVRLMVEDSRQVGELVKGTGILRNMKLGRHCMIITHSKQG